MISLINTQSYKFSKDHYLYKSGDPIKGLSVFFIKKGNAEIIYKLKGNKELIVEVPSGGFLGIFETLADKDKRITTAKFIDDTIVYCWNKEDFLNNVSVVSELGLKSVAFLSAFLRTLNIKIQEKG